MARGVDIPRKRVTSLTYIYGIGLKLHVKY